MNKIIKRYFLKKEYDIVISGLGAVGLSFALNLQKHEYFKNKKNILLIDKFNISDNSKNYEELLKLDLENHIPNQRVYTLSDRSMEFLNQLDLNKIDNSRIEKINKITVVDQEDESKLDFEDSEDKNLAYIMENDHLIYSLYNKAEELNLEMKFGEEIKQINEISNENKYEVIFNNNKIKTKLLIGSEGFNSQVAKLSNIYYNGHYHKQKAIVCTLKLDEPIKLGFQKFLETGPFAVLPLWKNYASLIWSLNNYNFDENVFKSDEEIIEILNKKIKPYNIVIKEIVNKRLSFPLKNLNSNQYVKNNIILIGDAAHSVHPMAGQGLNLGLSESHNLSNLIINNLNSGNDIRDSNYLNQFEKKSQNNAYLLQYGLEFIKLSYENKNENIKKLRNVTLNVLNKLPLKNIFKSIANGNTFYN